MSDDPQHGGPQHGGPQHDGTPRGPGRPRAVDTRARIVAAALTVFSARGFDATSVSRVAEEAGLSKQALQHHFPNKASLREAVYADLGERWDALYVQLGPQLASFDNAEYEQLIAQGVALFEAHGHVARFVARELLDQPAVAGPWLLAHADPWLSAAAAAQEGLRARGHSGVGVDAGAHLAIIASLLLSVSALLGGLPDEAAMGALKGRLRGALTQFISLASQLSTGERA